MEQINTVKGSLHMAAIPYRARRGLAGILLGLLSAIAIAVLTGVIFAPVSQAHSHQFSQLHWSDEFNGTSVDSSRWRVYYSNYGEGPGCNTPRNVSVGQGVLMITVRKETMVCPGGKTTTYSGGFLGSREVNRYYPLYGKYEMRARLPHGQGLWPSFWLRRIGGASHAEVDIFELFHNSGPGKITQSLHFPKSIGKGALKSGTYFEEVERAGIGGWHTFAVQISPVTPGNNSAVRFQFFVDGKMTKEYINYHSAAWTNVDPEKGWDMAISMNGGGDWAGLPDRHLGYITARGGLCAKNFRPPPGGNPDACPKSSIARPGDKIFLTNFAESSYIVDWVRVYRYNPSGGGATNPNLPPDVNGPITLPGGSVNTGGGTASPEPRPPYTPPPAYTPPAALAFTPPERNCIGTNFLWGATKCLDTTQADGSLEKNPVYPLVTTVARLLSALVGILVVAGVIWGGIVYASSKGSPAGVQKGRAIIGKSLGALVLYALMFAILNYLIPGGILT